MKKKILLIALLLLFSALSGCMGGEQCEQMENGCIEGCQESATTEAEAEQCYDACYNNPLAQLLCG